MPKSKKIENKQGRIYVSVYLDEFDTIKDKFDLQEVSTKEIRKVLGLTETRSKKGITGKLKEKLKELTEEQKVELLAKLEKE